MTTIMVLAASAAGRNGYVADLFGTVHCVGLSPLHTLLSRARRQRSNFSGKSFRARGLKRPRHFSAGFFVSTQNSTACFKDM